MPDSIHLDVVTPDRMVVSTDVTEVVAKGAQGEFGPLPGHANYLTLLDTGEMNYTRDGEEKKLAVTGGFAEVTPEHGIRVMAEAAEFAEEIDEDRAEAAKGRAQRRIKDYDPERQDIDVERAEAALRRALVRLQVAGKAGR